MVKNGNTERRLGNNVEQYTKTQEKARKKPRFAVKNNPCRRGAVTVNGQKKDGRDPNRVWDMHGTRVEKGKKKGNGDRKRPPLPMFYDKKRGFCVPLPRKRQVKAVFSAFSPTDAEIPRESDEPF